MYQMKTSSNWLRKLQRATPGPHFFYFEDAAPQLQQESGFENVWANFLTCVYSPVTGSKIVDPWLALAQSQLTRLIQSTLASLPSDAAVERLFSVAGYIQRPKRSKLSSKNLSNLLLVKYNFKE